VSTENLGTVEQNEEAFEEWFYKHLFMDGQTCLLREVLRRNRKNLFETWLEVRPRRFEMKTKESEGL